MTTLDELCDNGLIDDLNAPHLTDKGRDLLRALADVETNEVVDDGEAAAHLVLSTNGLFRKVRFIRGRALARSLSRGSQRLPPGRARTAS